MDKFFQYINFFPIPLWLAMMLAPRHPATERLTRSGTLFGVTALHYLLALAVALTRSSQGQGKINFTSLDGVRTMMGGRPGGLAVWAHMLALDLFTGAWIYRQARRLDAPAWVRVPSLFFTLMSGPFGLLLFLLWRTLSHGEQLDEQA